MRHVFIEFYAACGFGGICAESGMWFSWNLCGERAQEGSGEAAGTVEGDAKLFPPTHPATLHICIVYV